MRSAPVHPATRMWPAREVIDVTRIALICKGGLQDCVSQAMPACVVKLLLKGLQ